MDKTRKKFYFLILCIFLLTIFPFYAKAQGWWSALQFLFSSVTKMYEAGILFIFFLQLLILLLGSLNGFLALAVTLAISPGMIPWSYTRPGSGPPDNPFILAGLNITQGFISIGLILALVWIALATILRLEGYDTKRLLVKLIIVAMLVYFAPTICGLIVDAANVFMYYFTDKISGIGVLTNTFVSVGKQLLEVLANMVNPLAWPRIIAESLILIIVQFYLGLLLLAFFILFLFRHAAIWIAVILSPIAFICSILPSTKKYWDKWWTNFLGWVLAGPITAFFLYLGATLAQEVNKEKGLGTTLKDVFTDWFNVKDVIPHLFTIGVLQLGMIMGIQSGMIGGDLVYNWAKRGAGWVAGKVRAYGGRPGDLWKRAKERSGTLTSLIVGPERLEKWQKRWDEWGTRQATIPQPGAGVPGRRGVLIRTTTGPIWSLRRKVGEKMGPEQIEKDKLQMDAYQETLKGKGADLQFSRALGAKNNAERLGALYAMLSEGNSQAAEKFFNSLSENQRNDLFGFSERIGRGQILRAAFPHLARDYALTQTGSPGALPVPPGAPPGTPPQIPLGVKPEEYATQFVLNRINPESFKYLTEGALKDTHFLEALIKQDSPAHLQATINKFGKKGADAFTSALYDLTQRPGETRNPAQILKETAPNLYDYLSSAGRRSRLLIKIPGMQKEKPPKQKEGAEEPTVWKRPRKIIRETPEKEPPPPDSEKTAFQEKRPPSETTKKTTEEPSGEKPSEIKEESERELRRRWNIFE